MSRRFVQVADGSLVEVGKDYSPPGSEAPMVRGDTPGYFSYATNRWVEGAVQRREDLAVSGCRPFEGTETEQKEAMRQRAYNEEARDRKVEKSLRDIVPHMPQHIKRLFE